MPRKSTTAPASESATKTINEKLITPKVNNSEQTETEVKEQGNQQAYKAEKIKREVHVKEPLDPHSFITIRNGFNGRLVYVSKRTGERLVWDEFGSEQDMELQELKNAKNSARAFFENNWFMIDDPEVIAYLGVERYYKNALRFDSFDELFSKSPEEIKERVALLSAGQKASVAYRARQLIAAKKIDSIRVIEVLEESLSAELISH